MIRKYRGMALSGLLFLVSTNSFAFEPFMNLPSTRAASMAGVFSAQADDSSAIWYNPAGIKRSHTIAEEYSLDFSQQPVRSLTKPGSTSRETSHYGDSVNTLRFAAIYLDHIPFITNSSQNLGTGLAYIALNQLYINIDVAQTPLTTNTFGLVKASYRQLSWMLSGMSNEHLSFGATLDYVWAAVDCLEFPICVDNNPSGSGFSLGMLYDVYHDQQTQYNIGMLWRSKAALGYSSTPGSGIGKHLEAYLPERPGSWNFGANIQHSTGSSLLNLNFIYEEVLWSEATGRNPILPNYTNTGLGSEIIYSLSDGASLALRAGYRKAFSSNVNKLPDMQLWAAGFGYFFMHHHSIDLAIESRNTDFPSEKTSSTLSISYSLQY